MWLLFHRLFFLLPNFCKESIKKENVNRDIVRGVSVMLLSEIFIVLPFFYLYLLKEVNTLFPLLLILAIWASDIVAYFLARILEKTLCSTNQPEENIRGVIGGSNRSCDRNGAFQQIHGNRHY